MSRRHARLCAARWRQVRLAVFRRDGYRCTACGRTGRLECDHVDPDWCGDPYDMDNLQTLCRSCHIANTRAENRRPDTPAEAEWRRLVLELVDRA